MIETGWVSSTRERAREAFLCRFAWDAGHADVWRVFDDGPTFGAVVAGLVETWEAGTVTKVCGIEARGFLLGGAAAVTLGVGFVAIRKKGTLFPGVKQEIETEPDYRGNRHVLQLRADSVRAGDRLLLVDDWIERGSQAGAVQRLVEACGAVLAGIAVIVDQLDDARRAGLPPIASLVTANELPKS
jgi:adenine phosphoribosyltransferase